MMSKRPLLINNPSLTRKPKTINKKPSPIRKPKTINKKPS
jgi:hypothetical protein